MTPRARRYRATRGSLSRPIAVVLLVVLAASLPAQAPGAGANAASVLRSLVAGPRLTATDLALLDEIRRAYAAGAYEDAGVDITREITSLLAALETQASRERLGDDASRDAERLQLERAVSRPSRAALIAGAATTIVGSLSFATGAYLSGRGLDLADRAARTSDPDRREELGEDSSAVLRQAIVPLVGGSVLVAAGAAIVSLTIPTSPVQSATVSPALDQRSIDELLARRAELQQEFSASMARQNRYRRVARISLVTAAAGTAAAAGAIVLGQDAYVQYTRATFAEDAEALREGIQRLELASVAALGVAAGGLTVWSWSTAQRNEPRRILDEIRIIDSALAAR